MATQHPGRRQAPTITEHEAEQVALANSTGRTPVVFVHGLWLLPSSWDRWADAVRGSGLHGADAGVARRPGDGRRGQRPPRGDGEQDGRAGRRPLRGDRPQADAAAGGHRPLLRRAAGADPGRAGAVGGDGGDRPGPLPRRAAAAVLGAQVGLAGAAATRPTGSAPSRSPTNSSATASPTPSARTRRRSSTRPTPCPAPGAPLFQAAAANLNPWTEAKVDTENPDRGPLLIISGEKDHTVPWAIANASFKQQQKQPRRHRDRRDPEPRPRADHRQRLARGRRHRAEVHPTFHRPA